MGVSAKKSVSYGMTTFYGVSNDGYWKLNGLGCWSGVNGKNGEKIRERIKMNHFTDVDIEIDIYLDADKKILKMKRVGYSDKEEYEPMINNLYTGNNEEGWIPNFNFGSQADKKQRIMIARIEDESWYGQKEDIKWC